MPALAFGLAGPPSLPHVQFTTKDRCAPFRTASSTGLRRAGELIILSVNVRYGERRPAAQGRLPTCREPARSGHSHESAREGLERSSDLPSAINLLVCRARSRGRD